MAKAEVLHYFRHVGQEPRKDMRKYVTADSFKCKRVSLLLDSLLDLAELTRRHGAIVRQYNAEYLHRCDLPQVSRLSNIKQQQDNRIFL
jgi:hypothetical protein